MHVDCKTVRISAYSSTRDPRAANERSGTRLKTESETGERLSPHTPYGRVRLARFALKNLTLSFTDFFTDFEKKTRLFCSLSCTHPPFFFSPVEPVYVKIFVPLIHVCTFCHDARLCC